MLLRQLPKKLELWRWWSGQVDKLMHERERERRQNVENEENRLDVRLSLGQTAHGQEGARICRSGS
jgi:hypothetical protein